MKVCENDRKKVEKDKKKKKKNKNKKWKKLNRRTERRCSFVPLIPFGALFTSARVKSNQFQITHIHI